MSVSASSATSIQLAAARRQQLDEAKRQIAHAQALARHTPPVPPQVAAARQAAAQAADAALDAADRAGRLIDIYA